MGAKVTKIDEKDEPKKDGPLAAIFPYRAEEIVITVLARKRNAEGQLLGDIALPLQRVPGPNGTVTTQVGQMRVFRGADPDVRARVDKLVDEVNNPQPAIKR